ncbi:MAG: site-specific integrase [Desulfovibrionaceae bacterium]
MATIRKRGPYQWEARIRKKGHPTQSKTFERKQDAIDWTSEIESEMSRGVFISRAEAESTTVNEALNRYLVEHVPGLAHPDKEERRIRGLKRRQFTALPLAAIRGKTIAAFIKEREAEGVTANTIRLDLALLSKLFEVARRDWGMESLANPVQLVHKPKLPGGRTRRLEGDEEQRLYEAASDSLKPILKFALETAMRRSELADLRWNQVDIPNRSLHLPRTKNSTARTVPLSPAALEILKALPRDIQGSVFKMSPDSITKAFRRATAEADITGLTFHDLRHEAISRFFENTDLDAIEIAQISGHKSMQMLKRYSHLRTARLADRLAGKGRGNRNEEN